MADKMTPQQRSNCMRRISSKNTRPEMLVRRFLFSHGFRYRIHAKNLPGTPDCFWHGHEGCSMYKIPQTHVDFWTHKILRNKERDHENLLALKAKGWHTIEIWECQLKPHEREQTLQGLLRTLNYIALENQGAKVTYNFDLEEERSVAAEEEESEK